MTEIQWMQLKKTPMRKHKMLAPDHTVCNLTGEFVEPEADSKLGDCWLCKWILEGDVK